MADENDNRLGIDWVKTTAGALAAVSSAVLLSTLGAAGTLLGAALGSVAATVTTAIYSQGLARSRETVAAVAKQKVGVAQAEVHRAARNPDHPDQPEQLQRADERLAEASAELDDATREPAAQAPWRERLRALPWKRISLFAAGTFVLAVALLSVLEAVLGNPVSSYTGGSDKDGGTSITRLTGSDGSGDKKSPEREDRAPAKQDDDSRDPSDGPTATPTERASQEPSQAPSQSSSSEPSQTSEPEAPAPSQAPELLEQSTPDQRAPTGGATQ